MPITDEMDQTRRAHDDYPSDCLPKPMPTPQDIAAEMEKPENFGLDAINRAYTKFYKLYGFFPSEIYVGTEERDAMGHFACNVFNVPGAKPPLETDMDKFHRLLRHGVFCYGGIVLRLYVCQCNTAFSLGGVRKGSRYSVQLW